MIKILLLVYCQDIFIIHITRFKKVHFGAGSLVQQLLGQQLVLFHRESMTVGQRMFVNRMESDLEHNEYLDLTGLEDL